MHVRFSTCLGLPVVAEDSEEALGTLSGIVLHPDTGKVEGFFVRVSRFLAAEELFLSSMDITRFGLRVGVRERDVLAPAGDFLRIQPLLSEERTILGQVIRTASGRVIGRCRDIQFETKSMHLTWLFPRRWFKWGTPISVREVLEVRPDAIIVRDPASPAVEKVLQDAQDRLLPIFPKVPEGA
jgi:sporulation protein YlmC with PRC-barrel domain